MQGYRPIIILIALIAISGGGCSLSPYGQSALSAHLNLTYSEDPAQRLLPANRLGILSTPSAVSAFDCLAVNVVGVGIPSATGSAVSSSTLSQLLSEQTYCSYPGVTSAPFPVSGGTADLRVPIGSQRLIQIIGVQNAGSSVCSSQQPIGKLSNTGAGYYEIARSLIELTTSVSVTLTSSYNNLSSTAQTSRQVNCGDSSTASKLAIASNSTIGYAQCLSLTITSANSSGTTTAVSSATTVNLSSTAGAFYSDSSCASAVSSTSLSSGSSQATVYYKSSTLGSATLTAADAAQSLTSATQSVSTYLNAAYFSFVLRANGGSIASDKADCGSSAKAIFGGGGDFTQNWQLSCSDSTGSGSCTMTTPGQYWSHASASVDNSTIHALCVSSTNSSLLSYANFSSGIADCGSSKTAIMASVGCTTEIRTSCPSTGASSCTSAVSRAWYATCSSGSPSGFAICADNSGSTINASDFTVIRTTTASTTGPVEADCGSGYTAIAGVLGCSGAGNLTSCPSDGSGSCISSTSAWSRYWKFKCASATTLETTLVCVPTT